MTTRREEFQFELENTAQYIYLLNMLRRSFYSMSPMMSPLHRAVLVTRTIEKATGHVRDTYIATRPRAASYYKNTVLIDDVFIDSLKLMPNDEVRLTYLFGSTHEN